MVIVAASLALGCHGSSSDTPQATPGSGAEATANSQPDDEQPAKPAPSPSAATPQAKPPGPPPGPSGVDELHRLEGQPETAVLAEFGEPSRKREFPMRECCTEFAIELYNTYPPDGGHGDVVIREWTWDYEGYDLTVWLHQREGAWEVLETCRYSDDVEF
jgi:hypothetical protein